MKFELTRTEYQRLTELIYLGEWFINAHRAGDDPQVDEYETVIQKLYAYAPKLGFGQWINYFQPTNSFSPTRKMEDESPCEQYIREYDEETFWQELCSRLAERDIVQEIGRGAQFSLPNMEHMERLVQRQQELMQLFIKEGLDCLTIKGALGNNIESEDISRPD